MAKKVLKKPRKKRAPNPQKQIEALAVENETLLGIVNALMFRFGHDMGSGLIEALVRVPINGVVPVNWEVNDKTQAMILRMQLQLQPVEEPPPTQGTVGAPPSSNGEEEKPVADEDEDLEGFAAGLRGDDA